MKRGLVIGTVWASKSVPELHGCRLHVIQPMTHDGARTGSELVAADPQRLASSGAVVMYVTSADAASAFDSGRAPVNASIVGIIDEAIQAIS